MAIPKEEMHAGEKIVKEITPSGWGYFWQYMFGWVMISIYVVSVIYGIIFEVINIWFTRIWLLVLGMMIILITELIRRANTYYITDKRIIHEFTLFSRKISSALYEKITDLHFNQGLVERIVGIGTVYINTAGTQFSGIKFVGVKDPAVVKRLIEETMVKRHKEHIVHRATQLTE